jgi:hypothetical protein
MTQYYGTGRFYKKDLPKINRFMENHSQISTAARIYQRNNVLYHNNDPKKIIATKHENKTYKANWNEKNQVGKGPYYKHARKSQDIKCMTQGKFNQGHKESFNHKFPNNAFALRKVRRHIFTQGYKKPFDKTRASKVLSKEDFSKRSSVKPIAAAEPKTTKGRNKKKSHFIERQCLYRTKPLLRLNNDFLPKEKVTNSQKESADRPDFLKNANYDHLRVMNTRQLKRQLEAQQKKKNVLGQNKHHWKKRKPIFRADPPHVGMRYETNRMVILPEPKNRKDAKFYSIYQKDGKVRRSVIDRLGWNEDTKKQKNYEYKHVPKIGAGQEPWIKALKRKNVIIPIKIGDTQTTLRKTEKIEKIKIGHVY